MTCISSKLGYPINAKSQRFFAKYLVSSVDEIKNDRFYRHRKTSKITLFLSLHFFGQKYSLQKKGLQGVIESYRGLQGVTWGYKGLQ